MEGQSYKEGERLNFEGGEKEERMIKKEEIMYTGTSGTVYILPPTQAEVTGRLKLERELVAPTIM